MNPSHLLRKIFKPKQAATLQAVAQGGVVVVEPQAPLFKGEPIPSYPDRGVAVPAASPELLIESQRELLDNLHQTSAFSYDEFAELLLPAIRNYAAYAHLLPASESNHHCGQGGLFRHGLEVACNAALACESKVFAMDHWASERHHLVPRWRMCAILGGMLHDLGKPLIDVGAIDSTGELKWNPHTHSLWDWLQLNHLEHYYIHWRPGARFKRHEAFTTLAVYRIVPQRTLEWIGEHGGQEAFDAMVLALTGSSDPQNPLAALIRQSDSKSVDRDIKDSRSRLSASGQGGQRSQALRLVRAIHDFIEAGTWTINKMGSPIWFTDEGIFGFYPQVVSEAVNALREQGETSIPTDVSSSLTMLSDWGYLHPRLHANGQSSDTWNVRIHATDRGKPASFDFQFIRFAREDILPAALLPPVALHAELLGVDGQPLVSGMVTPHQECVPVTIAAPAMTPGPTEPSEPSPPPDIVEQVEAVLAAAASTPQTPKTEAAQQPVPLESLPPLRDRGAEKDVRTAKLDEAHERYHAVFPPTTPEGALEWLGQSAQQPEGAALVKIAKRIQSGQLKEGTHVFDANDRVHLRSPEAFTELGWAQPVDFRLRLEQRGWTETESPTSTRTTVGLSYQGKVHPCTRLTETISTVFRLLMPARSSEKLLEQAGIKKSTMPLGPRITAEMATCLRSLTAHDPLDGPLIRPVLHHHLCDGARQAGIQPVELTHNMIDGQLHAFMRQHTIRNRGWIIQHVLDGATPVCLSSEQARAADPLAIHELRFNPAYDPQPDLDLSETKVPA